ncbi:hypothetical protein H4582DRAFT_755016 [Lactarius indigo]|nr:hypothetical protein H4582DRAFT_755016 [Lactarius indigo]
MFFFLTVLVVSRYNIADWIRAHRCPSTITRVNNNFDEPREAADSDSKVERLTYRPSRPRKPSTQRIAPEQYLYFPGGILHIGQMKQLSLHWQTSSFKLQGPRTTFERMLNRALRNSDCRMQYLWPVLS